MSKDNEFKTISNIMKSIGDYQDEKIEEHIAELNYRIENVEQVKKITDNKRSTSIYYRYKRIQQSHRDLESAYTNYNKNSLDEKFSMMAKVDQIQNDLCKLEESDDE